MNNILRIYDRIGDQITDESVAAFLEAAEDGGATEIDVRVNSAGGEIAHAVAIYNQLRACGKRVVVTIEGIAASSATIIAMAGDAIRMFRSAQMVIHNPFFPKLEGGDASYLRMVAARLDSWKTAIMDVYESRVPQLRDVIDEMMNRETWLTAYEAVRLGFATEIVGGDAVFNSLDLSAFDNVPDTLKGKTMNDASTDVKDDQTQDKNVEQAAEKPVEPVAAEAEEQSEQPAEPKAESPVAAATVEPAKGAENTVSMLTVKQFTDHFGATNGLKWLQAGKSFHEALEAHNAVLQAEISTLKTKLGDAENRLKVIGKSGEAEPIDQTPKKSENTGSDRFFGG